METTRQPCPECGATLELPISASGRKARCPNCQAIFVVPAAGQAPATAGTSAAVPPSPTAPPPRKAEGTVSPMGSPDAPRPGAADPFAAPPQRPVAAADNPYAMSAGMASAAVEPAKHGELLIRTPNIDEIVSATTSIFTNRWQPLVIGGLIVFAFNVISSIVGQIFPALGSLLGEAGLVISTVLFQLLSSLIGFYLTVGLVRTSLAVARNQPAPASMMFPHPAVFGRVLVTMLIPMLILMLIGAVLGGIGAAVYFASGQADEVAAIMVISGGLLFMVLYFALFFLLWPSVYVASEEREWGMGAIRTGYAIGIVNKLNSFLFLLISMALGILGMLACCVGGIATTPATFLVGAVGYLMMTSQPISDPQRMQMQMQPQGYANQGYGSQGYGNQGYGNQGYGSPNEPLS